jgi:hypothetical protein
MYLESIEHHMKYSNPELHKAERRLDFNARNKIDYALKHAFPYPMRQDTMQSKYPQMYTEIFSCGSNSRMVA